MVLIELHLVYLNADFVEITNPGSDDFLISSKIYNARTRSVHVANC